MARELSELFRRDLARLIQELQAFPEGDAIWQKLPGVDNSAGNLTLHLEGNLREFIGRQLGQVPYARQRNLEFTLNDMSPRDLIVRIEDVRDVIPPVIARLSAGQLDALFPEKAFGAPISTQQFLLSLYGHFSYHLGQIDYLRRILTEGGSVQFVALK